jgi:hypothetical protein
MIYITLTYTCDCLSLIGFFVEISWPVPDPLHFGVDTDPDPRIHASD